MELMDQDIIDDAYDEAECMDYMSYYGVIHNVAELVCVRCCCEWLQVSPNSVARWLERVNPMNATIRVFYNRDCRIAFVTY